MVGFYFDENAGSRIVMRRLRALGVQVESASTVNMLQSSDTRQLEFAAANGWCLVTQDLKDFVPLHFRFIAEGRTHGGVVIIRQEEFSFDEIVRRLLILSQIANEADLAGQLLWLRDWR